MLSDDIKINPFIVNENFNYWAGVNYEARNLLYYLAVNRIIPRVGEAINWPGSDPSKIIWIHYSSLNNSYLNVFMQIDWGGWDNMEEIKEKGFSFGQEFEFKRGEELFIDSWKFERNFIDIHRDMLAGNPKTEKDFIIKLTEKCEGVLL